MLLTMKASKSKLRERVVVPTNLPELDALLGGGVFMRRIAMLSGRYSCGKSTLAAMVVAEAQKQGMDALWCDVENRFNFDYFATLGVNLDKLDFEGGLVAEEYFKIIHKWIEKHSGIIVLDSVAALLTRDESEKEDGPSVPQVPKMLPNFLKRVTNELAAADKPSALIFINQERIDFDGALKVIGGRSVEHFVTQWVRMRRLTAPKQVIMKSGKKVADKIEMIQQKDASQYAICTYELWPGQGFKATKASPTLTE